MVPAGTVTLCVEPGEVGAHASRGASSLAVRLEGARPEVHDHHAGEGSFARALAVLAAIRAHGLEPVAVTTVTRSNARDLRALASLLRARGCARWVIRWPVVDQAVDAEVDVPFTARVPRFGLAVPAVLAAAQDARARGLEVALEGFPRCALGPFAALARPTPPRAYAAPCRACQARPSCPGVDPVYLERFGPGELHPLGVALRVLMIGTGRRAARLHDRFASVPGLTLVGVASPRSDRGGFWGDAPSYAEVSAALDALRPDAALIASSTPSHRAAVQACAARGVPALLEKPVAGTAAEAEALAAEAGWVSCALQELFEPGIGQVLAREGALRWVRRVGRDTDDAPPSFERGPLLEVIHHALTLPVAGRGPLERVERLEVEGEDRPTRLEATLVLARGRAEIELDFDSDVDSAALFSGGAEWRREGREVTVDGAPLTRRRAAESAMLARFQHAVIQEESPPAPLALGVEILRASEALLEALAEAGRGPRSEDGPKQSTRETYRRGGSRR